MVKHIVTFRLHGEPAEITKAADAFRAALMALPAKIDVLRSMEVGINANPAETWHVVLTAEVPTMADVTVYAKHPDHVAAAAIIKPFSPDRACVDYEL